MQDTRIQELEQQVAELTRQVEKTQRLKPLLLSTRVGINEDALRLYEKLLVMHDALLEAEKTEAETSGTGAQNEGEQVRGLAHCAFLHKPGFLLFPTHTLIRASNTTLAHSR